jgi:hypothetical protein
LAGSTVIKLREVRLLKPLVFDDAQACQLSLAGPICV